MNKVEQCVCYYLNEKDTNTDFYPDASALADGSVLRALLEKFSIQRNDTTLYAVMRCLRDSILFVKSDFSQCHTEKGRLYVKAYSSPQENRGQKSISAYDLAEKISENEKISGVVIDPETYCFVMGADLLAILANLPSEF